MSDVSNSLSSSEMGARTHALIAYVLMIAGLFTGLFLLLGAIWAMMKNPGAGNSKFAGHYSNMITVFWFFVAGSIVGWILAFILIGYAVWFGVWLWSGYRLITGLLALMSNKAYG